jgi:hypothetical protein
VVFLSMLPYKDSAGKPLEKFTALCEKSLGVGAQELLKAYRSRSAEVTVCGTGNMRLVRTGPLFLSDPREPIESQIGALIERDIRVRVRDASKGNIYCSHWRKEGKEIYFIVNSDERAYATEVSLRALGEPSFWNPESGEREPAHCYREEDGHLSVSCGLDPLQSVFLVVDVQKKAAPRIVDTNARVLAAGASEIELVRGEAEGPLFVDVVKNGSVRHVELAASPDREIALSDRWAVERGAPNVLALNRWQVVQGFSEGVGWFNMLGGTVTWEVRFQIDRAEGNLRAVFDRVPEPNRIEINGKPVTEFQKSTYLDHGMREVDIRKLVKQGENRLTISFELAERAFQGKTGITPIELMFDPAMIIGDFALEPAGGDEEYVIVGEKKGLATGSWADQGYPFYTGSIEYRQRVYLEEDFIRGRRCVLEAQEVREIASLGVNDAAVGVRPWKPYTWDVTAFLKPGENEIRIRVWNTLTNLLDLKKQDCGIIGKVRIVSREVMKARLS